MPDMKKFEPYLKILGAVALMALLLWLGGCSNARIGIGVGGGSGGVGYGVSVEKDITPAKDNATAADNETGTK